MNLQNLSNCRENRFEQWMHNRKFESTIVVVPDSPGLDLFGAGEVIPVVPDIPRASRLGSASASSAASVEGEFQACPTGLGIVFLLA